jgi:hypothetical protein
MSDAYSQRNKAWLRFGIDAWGLAGAGGDG